MTLLRRIPALLLAVTLALAVGIVPAPALLLAAPVAQTIDPTGDRYYESDLIPGTGETPDLVVGLLLYEDGSAEVISDYQNDEDVIIEVGTWVDNGDGTLTLTVTGTTDSDYAAPIDLDFNIGDDGALVVPGAANGAFGEAGLILNPTTLGNSEAILAEIPAEALVFQSDVLPADPNPGLQLTLALFDDGSLTLVSDYMSPGEIVVEVGTWVENEDSSLAVTLTGQVEDGDGEVTEYEAPLEFVFTLNDDDSLSLVDEDGALFGEAGLTLLPIEATGDALSATAPITTTEGTTAEATAEATEEAAEGEATAEATEEAGEEATPEPTEEATAEPEEEATAEATEEATPEASEEVAEATPEPEEEATAGDTGQATDGDAAAASQPSGIYISGQLGEGAESTFLVTVFDDDGDMVFSTYQLDGELPVTERGIWGDNGDGTLTITATGTLEEEYIEPFEVEFTLDEDGNVNIADVTLYALESVNFAGEPSLIAQFESEPITDTIDLSHTLTLLVYEDASAELMTAYADESQSFTEYGEWVIDEATDQLTVTITGDDEEDYAEPIEWLFDVTAEDTLVLANDDEGYYGEDGLTLLAVGLEEEMLNEGAATDEAGTEDAGTEDTGEDAAADDVGATDVTTATEGVQIFQSDVLPAAASPGLQLTLGLLDDGSAALDYDYLNGEEVVTNLGEWTENDDGTITLVFTEGPNGTLELPVELTLELDAEGNLVIIDASEESLGLLDVTLAPFALE